MAPDGEVGEPAYATSDGLVESKCFATASIVAVVSVMFMSWPFLVQLCLGYYEKPLNLK